MGTTDGTRGVAWGRLKMRMVAATGAALALAGLAAAPAHADLLGGVTGTLTGTTSKYVVTDTASPDASAAQADVQSVGGLLDPVLNLLGGNLSLLSSVVADLSSDQVASLQQIPTATVTPDVTVTMSSTTDTTSGSGRVPAAVFPQQTGATQLWSQGDSGSGVNVAVLDTGIDPLPDFSGRLQPGVDLSGEGNAQHDSYGHGTFVAGLVAGNGATSAGQYKGEAPAAGLVPVKVAGSSGATDLATVISGVGWVIAHHSALHIGVLNLSLGYVPTLSTAVNPLDQAVERAWQAGVVVVAAAGNSGPFNGTILSPGDDPLVITVGAVDDHGSVSTAGDTMTSFSSVGPTSPDGWFKPDIVASGRSVVSLEAPGSTVAQNNPTAVVGTGNFVGSGTSFSSAITSGAAALLLANHPTDRPNDVKALMLGTAAPGPVGNPFVDGHGLLNVAVANSANGKLHLAQGFGSLHATMGSPGGSQAVQPGNTVQAGYVVQMGGTHPAATTWMSGGQVNIPMACTSNGPVAGTVEVDVPSTPVNIARNSTTLSTPIVGTGTAPDLCNGATLYPTNANGANVVMTGSLISTDTKDPVTVEFNYNLTGTTSGYSPKVNVVPTTTTTMGQVIDLGSAWSGSSWNGSSWNGSSWNGSSWNGSSWNGSSWNGSSWNGSAWSGSAWSGSAWSGSAWSGSAWSGSAWSGSAWSGSAWSGSAWSGSAWNGSAWSGSAWSGSAWSGSAWSSSPTTGSDSTSTASLAPGESPYYGYYLASTSPDRWCPVGVNLGNAGSNGAIGGGGKNAGAGGIGGSPGCGSNGGSGGHGGNADSHGGAGGTGGNGGNGGCQASTDAQMAAGQFPCDGTGANGGNGGNGGNAQNGNAGGTGGNGGQGGNAQGAQAGPGGNGGSGGPTGSGVTGGNGGNGGGGGSCPWYAASYWVGCPSQGGHGGNGGAGAQGFSGGNGGTGGAAGTVPGANGGNGSNGTSATNTANGVDGTAGSAG